MAACLGFDEGDRLFGTIRAALRAVMPEPAAWRWSLGITVRIGVG